MTIEEILNDMQLSLRLWGRKPQKESVEMCIKVLEKQVPKKAIYNVPCHVKAFDSETEKVYTYSCVPCPVCHKWIVVNVNHKYCEYCGQVLNWGAKDE